MSIRAHRVNRIFFDGESFNLWHDQEIVDYLESNGLLEHLNADLCGFIEIHIEDLKNILAITDGDTREAIGDDIKWAEEEKQDYVLYYCF